jgi:D-serine dehydratase
MLDLAELSRHKLSATSKGIPHILDGVTIEDAPKRGLNLLRDPFPAPVAVLRESALRANIELMRQYTRSAGVELAPHGKTTMAAQLFDLQLEAGAWGITCATAAHLRVYRRFGVPRIVMANQLLDTDSVQFVARELAGDPGFEFYGIVDSVAGARQYHDVLSHLPRGRPLNLLLEVGAAGGRTGVRTVADALLVAREVAGMSDSLQLAGIEAFEGIFAGSPRDAESSVESFMNQVSDVARRCDDEHLFSGETIVLTAGGSAYFDQVVKALGAIRLSRPTKVVLRSGCYITHDHGFYAAALERLRERNRESGTGNVFSDRAFEPALQLWTTVQSLPERGLAIIALGKRDVSFDMGLPVPLEQHRPGSAASPASIRGKAEIVRLNDHHGYLRFTDLDLAVKDRIAVGISHPCTTFDRWEYLYVVNDRYDVVSVVRTFF